MTTFQDGPAAGTTLMLKRAVRFLRVVVDAKNKVDALDQLYDQPAAGEKIFAYEITANPTMCHLNCGGGRGGFYPIANYRLVPQQPDDATLRDTFSWGEWCQKTFELSGGRKTDCLTTAPVAQATSAGHLSVRPLAAPAGNFTEGNQGNEGGGK